MGFTEWPKLFEVVVQEMARRGDGHKPCPLTSALLLDPAIYNQDGFSSKAEKEDVPAWRCGQAGKNLQEAMCEVARCRLFDHGMVEPLTTNGKSLFSSGAIWATLARLNGPPHDHLQSIMERLFGPRVQWPDSVRSLDRAIWTGDHDQEIGKISSVMPSSMDAQPLLLQKRLSELFTPLLQVIQARETEAQRLEAVQQKQSVDLQKQKEQEEAMTAAVEKDDLSGLCGVWFLWSPAWL